MYMYNAIKTRSSIKILRTQRRLKMKLLIINTPCDCVINKTNEEVKHTTINNNKYDCVKKIDTNDKYKNKNNRILKETRHYASEYGNNNHYEVVCRDICRVLSKN